MSDTVKFLRKFFKEDETIYFRLILEGKDNHMAINAEATINQLKKEMTVYASRSDKKYNLNEMNKRGFGIFFVVNSGGHANKDIQHINSYFVDVDMGKETFICDSEYQMKQKIESLSHIGHFSQFKESFNKKTQKHQITALYTLEEIAKKKNGFLKMYNQFLSRAEILETYSGFHCYFIAEEKESPKDFNGIQLGIAKILGGDRACQNPARVMRLEGFAHNKYAQKPVVKVVQEGKGSYTKQSLIDLFNIKSEQTKGATKKTSFQEDYSGKSFQVTNDSFVATDIEWKKGVKFTDKMNYREFLEYAKTLDFSEFIVNWPKLEPDKKLFNCFFHDDETPSANVAESADGEKFYNCFAGGCGVAGDIVKIYQLSNEKVTWKDSLDNLAAMLGIKIVSEQWRIDNLDKNEANATLIDDFKDDERMTSDGFEALSKVLTQKRRELLQFMIRRSNKHTIKEEFLDQDGNTVFFISIPEITRKTRGSSIRIVWQNIKMLTLLGFIKRVPLEDAPKGMRERAIKERKRLEVTMEKAILAKGGEVPDFELREISFYSIPWFEDIIEEAIERALKIKELGFSTKRHMNKNDLTLMFGKDIAQTIYPDDREASKHEKMYQRFEKVILKEIERKGFCLNVDVLKTKISKEGGGNYLNKNQMEANLKRFLPTILDKNGLVSQNIRSDSKKQKYGYKGKLTTITVIKRP